MIHRFFSGFILTAFTFSLLPFSAFAQSAPVSEKKFTSPIDAFSVTLADFSFEYQYLLNGQWSDVKKYETDGDVLPGEESELLMVPRGVTGLRVSGVSADSIHAITVSHDPVKPRIAAMSATASTPVLQRAEWGADASYLYAGAVSADDEKVVETDAAKGDNGAAVSTSTNQRAKDCQQAQKDHPDEFKYASTVTKDANGKEYLWPLQYSASVKMLVVHHSALVVKDDPRPSVERVRAIYKYHALTKGWGDIGYHYIIDERGQVYEGRQGGKGVVGGHVYCNNVGTIGIVLLGNFEVEQPSQAQAKSLQWLLADLGKTYKLNLSAPVQFHGKKFDSPIVGHRDLLSTLCPGYYLAGALSQIVKHAQTGDIDAAVSFPKAPGSSKETPPPSPPPAGVQEGISFTGRTAMTMNPGGKQRLSFTYTAGREGAYESKRIAEVRISDPGIILSIDDGRNWVPITKGVLLQSDLPAYETVSVQLIVQAPMKEGNYSMNIGGLEFTIAVTGRRARTGEYVSPFTAQTMQIVKPKAKPPSTTLSSRIRPQSRLSQQSSSASSQKQITSSLSSTQAIGDSSIVRVRLSSTPNPTIRFADKGSLNGVAISPGTALSLSMRNGQCEALKNGERLVSADILRLSSQVAGVLTVDSVRSAVRSYRGVIECRVVDGVLTLINELPLESYMLGVAEEPDTEPYEKQRAFAIAARTYALYYMSGSNRKFPGKPYDGSDDPAVFQLYTGVTNEAANPRWVKAVESTSNQILSYQGKVIKPPYFSSDDGRTRSPAEAGWKNFPAAEILFSKSDPWCVGMELRGHGVGMSGCGAKAQANEGRSAEQILQYYYPGARITER